MPWQAPQAQLQPRVLQGCVTLTWASQIAVLQLRTEVCLTAASWKQASSHSPCRQISTELERPRVSCQQLQTVDLSQTRCSQLQQLNLPQNFSNYFFLHEWRRCVCRLCTSHLSRVESELQIRPKTNESLSRKPFLKYSTLLYIARRFFPSFNARRPYSWKKNHCKSIVLLRARPV